MECEMCQACQVLRFERGPAQILLHFLLRIPALILDDFDDLGALDDQLQLGDERVLARTAVGLEEASAGQYSNLMFECCFNGPCSNSPPGAVLPFRLFHWCRRAIARPPMLALQDHSVSSSG